MDQQSVNEEDLVDLELGENGCQNDSKDEPITGNRRTKSMLRLASGVLNYDASAKGDYRTNSYDNSGSSSGNQHGNIELFIDSSNVGARDHMPLIEKSHAKEKCKTMKPKKSSKPPRPPKGPILDTADMKLMKEFSELAMKKRARVERMKTLKKLKAAKSSLASSSSSSMSSGSSLTSMVITILFFLIIIYQGIFSQTNSSVRIQGSPGPEAAGNGLITVQLYSNHFPTDGDAPSSESPTSLDRASGSEFRASGSEFS